MTLDVKRGDVLTYWHDDGWRGQLGYARVLRVNRATVDVETEHRVLRRVRLTFFTGRVKPGEWIPWERVEAK